MAEQQAKVSRRGFLKLAGVTGALATTSLAGVTVEAAAKNQAEVMADPAGRPQRPWWVRTVDKPTNVKQITDAGNAKLKQRGLDNVPGCTVNDQAL